MTSPADLIKHNISNTNLDLPLCRMYPKVVLQRLTASQLSNVKSAPENCSVATGALDGWNSTCTTPVSHSFCEPGPSTSTPKTCRNFGFDSRNIAGQASKARRLSTLFQNEKDIVGKIRKRKIIRVQDDSESD